MNRINVFLIVVALIAGMVGCVDVNMFEIDPDTGELLETITLTSQDKMLTVTIPEGTIALDKDGNPLLTLEIDNDLDPPAPPEDAHIIGLAYDLGPAGATFDPAMTFTWEYSPADIPEGVNEEDLVIAYYDEAKGEWVIPESVVDTATNIITASVSHLTTFAIAAVPPVQYNLTISSTAGGNVTIPGEGTFTYDAGTVVSLDTTPDVGYQFVNWTGDMGTIASVNASSTTITVEGNYSITANFEVIPPIQYRLNISRTAGGRVRVPGEGTFTYNTSMVISLVATPLSGYYFVSWTGDVSTIANVNAASTTITMVGNCSIIANFEEEGGEEPCYFTDPNLEAAIREAIGKPTGPIYPSDLEGLTTFRPNSNDIADLTGLECCTSLTYLWIDYGQISDISPLANLTSLAGLDLNYNQISIISPLANLTSLRALNISHNQINDISPLTNLTNLREIDLENNQINDISSLANLTTTTWLHINSNQISDISPLANLTMHDLYIRDNQISDISPLVQNDTLGDGSHVDLRDNPLSSDSINVYIPQLQARGVTVDY